MATTQPDVTVTESAWSQISAAEIQTLQVKLGTAGVIYAASQPASTVQVGSIGHVLPAPEFLNNSTGGTSWGRSENGSGNTIIGLTEG